MSYHAVVQAVLCLRGSSLRITGASVWTALNKSTATSHASKAAFHVPKTCLWGTRSGLERSITSRTASRAAQRAAAGPATKLRTWLVPPVLSASRIFVTRTDYQLEANCRVPRQRHLSGTDTWATITTWLRIASRSLFLCSLVGILLCFYFVLARHPRTRPWWLALLHRSLEHCGPAFSKWGQWCELLHEHWPISLKERFCVSRLPCI
jgi:hypothetical protein